MKKNFLKSAKLLVGLAGTLALLMMPGKAIADEVADDELANVYDPNYVGRYIGDGDERLGNSQGSSSAEEVDYSKLTGLKPIESEEITDFSSYSFYDPDEELVGLNERGASEAEYWRKFGNKYYYNKLDDAQKKLWDDLDSLCLAILEGSQEAQNGSTPAVNTSISYSDTFAMRRAVYLFKFSNPQYFFLTGGFNWGTRGGQTYVSLWVYDAFCGRSAFMQAKNQFRSAVDSYLSQIDTKSLYYPERIEKTIHDLICDNVTYQYGTYDQSAYSTFVQKNTVCAGYTAANCLLGNACGLNIIPVTGFGSGQAHAWNMINLYDHWYLVDVTWDDGAYGINYNYYNKGRQSTLDHEPSARTGNEIAMNELIPEYPYDSSEKSYDGSYMDPMLSDGEYAYFIVSAENPSIARVAARTQAEKCIFYAPDSIEAYGLTYSVEPWNNYTGGANVAKFVDRLYSILLDRDAEVKGIEDWSIKLLKKTSSAAEIVQGIACSPEYKNKKLDNETSVERMYESMLGRASDEGGKADWVGRLNNGMTLSAIVNGFSGSNEFGKLCNSYGINPGSVEPGENRDKNAKITAFSARCYTKALNRSYDVNGLNHWSGELLSKNMTAESVAHGFVFSTEFENRNLSNEEFVDTMYALCFDRSADDAGKNDWLRRMKEGASREDVFSGFAHSQEFANLVASFGL